MNDDDVVTVTFTPDGAAGLLAAIRAAGRDGQLPPALREALRGAVAQLVAWEHVHRAAS